MLNGAPTFISLVGGLARPHEVRLELPAGWKTSATALTPVGGQPHTYRAEDFDTLVDSPIIVGNSGACASFTVAGKRHYLVLEGDTAFFDVDRAAADVQKIVEAGGQVMGGRFDYPHYYVLNVVTDAGGGLEHKNSFLGDGRAASRRARRRAYLGWLGPRRARVLPQLERQAAASDRARAVRLRERGLHQGAVDCRGLYRLLRRPARQTRRACRSRDEYLEELSGQIEAVQTTPGRLVDVGRHGVLRHVDQAVSPRREHAEHDRSTTTRRAPSSRFCSTRASAAPPTAPSRSTMRCGSRTSAIPAPKGYTLEQFYQTMSDAAGTDLRPWFATDGREHR